jgi:hypothetical protein
LIHCRHERRGKERGRGIVERGEREERRGTSRGRENDRERKRERVICFYEIGMSCF